MNWALSFPEKRGALAQPGVSDEITPATRKAASKAMASAAELMQWVHAPVLCAKPQWLLFSHS
jgi:hypothetical protein